MWPERIFEFIFKTNSVSFRSHQHLYRYMHTNSEYVCHFHFFSPHWPPNLYFDCFFFLFKSKTNHISGFVVLSFEFWSIYFVILCSILWDLHFKFILPSNPDWAYLHKAKKKNEKKIESFTCNFFLLMPLSEIPNIQMRIYENIDLVRNREIDKC